MQGLVNISDQMDNVSCEKGSLSRVPVHIGLQDLVGLVQNIHSIDHCFCIVDLREDSVINIGAVDKMPGVPEMHVVLLSLDVIRPACRLYECLRLFVHQVVDGLHNFFELSKGIWVDFLEAQLGNGSSKHVASIPPSEPQDGQHTQKEKRCFHEQKIISSYLKKSYQLIGQPRDIFGKLNYKQKIKLFYSAIHRQSPQPMISADYNSSHHKQAILAMIEEGSNKSSTEKEMKQYYLREEIIDSGYDPEQFVSFLNERKNINSDIDQCSLEELEDIVVSFKKKKSEEKQEIKKYYKSDALETEEDRLCEKISMISDNRPVILKSNPEIKEEEFMKQLKCVRVNPTHQEIQEITCEVNHPERKELGGVLGFGTRSYLCFKVWSYGLRKKPVFRRYSDFIWLRNTLLKFYPSQIIPPIPNKKASKRSARQIQKRMRILTMFLNDLVRNQVLLNNKYTDGFLMIDKHEQFEKLKEQADNIKPYESIYSTVTKNGNVWLELTDRTVNYKDGLIKFVPQAEAIYKEITRNSKKLRAMTVENIDLLYSMSNQFAELHQITSKFHLFVESGPTKKLSQIYAVLNNVMAEWGNSLRDQAQQIEKNLSTFFKYVREQFMGFQELILKEEEVLNDFIKQKDALNKQKDKIFQLKDIKKWEIPKNQIENVPKSAIYDKKEAFKIMLPKESVKIEQEKQKLGYYLSELMRNGEANFLRTIDKFCENFKQFSIKMKVSNQRVGAMWTEVSAKFSDPFKKYQDIQRMQSIKEEQSRMEDSSSYY